MTMLVVLCLTSDTLAHNENNWFIPPDRFYICFHTYYVDTVIFVKYVNK